MAINYLISIFPIFILNKLKKAFVPLISLFRYCYEIWVDIHLS